MPGSRSTSDRTAHPLVLGTRGVRARWQRHRITNCRNALRRVDQGAFLRLRAQVRWEAETQAGQPKPTGSGAPT